MCIVCTITNIRNTILKYVKARMQSIVIQGNSIGVLSSGLLAELPAILDSLFTNTTSDFIGVVGRG